MAKWRGDDRTLDLLNWKPPAVAVRFEDESRVRAASLAHRISRSVSETLKDDGRSRAEIAAAMSDFLGEPVSENMLNAYAAAGREEHNISLERAEALLHATGDSRIFGDILLRHGFAAIPRRFLAAIEEAMCDEVIERATQRKKMSRRTWKGGAS